MKPYVRKFVEEEEARQARSAAAKRKRRRKSHDKLVRYIAEHIARLEANGNPRKAQAEREFWSKSRRYGKAIRKAVAP